MGKSGSVKQRPAMKWSLNVLIVRLAEFQRYIPGGVSWELISLELSYIWKTAEASLLSLVYYVLIPLVIMC